MYFSPKERQFLLWLASRQTPPTVAEVMEANSWKSFGTAREHLRKWSSPYWGIVETCPPRISEQTTFVLTPLGRDIAKKLQDCTPKPYGSCTIPGAKDPVVPALGDAGSGTGSGSGDVPPDVK